MPWALVLATVASQAPLARIEAARQAMAELRYPEAKALLQKARQEPSLTRAQLLDVLWLQGLVSASLNQPDGARAAFRALFAIDPEHQPDRDYPPKVMSPYYEARGWIATNKPLGFAPLPPVLEGGRVKRIGVRVQADPLALVTGVRIYVVGGETTEHQLDELTVTRQVDAETVSWWAELIGERGAQLGLAGSPEQPLVDRAAAPQPPAPRPAPTQLSEPTTPPTHPLRAAGYAGAAAGLGALAVGAVFGVRSNNLAQVLRARTYDGDGVVVGWTQAEAARVDAQQRREAGVANAMFIVAGVLVAAAVALWVLGWRP